MEQKLSDTLVKAIDRSNPMMQNLQLASRFNKLVEEGGGGSANLEDNKEVTITENGEIEITPTEGKDGMKKVTATVNVASDYTVETKVFDKNSETFTLDCSDKTFIYMMTVANDAVGKGIAGFVSDFLEDFQVYISASGSTIGLMSWDAETKTITYSSNAGSQVSDAVTFKLVVI